MNAIANLVMVRGKPRSDMVGRRMPDSLTESDEEISAGLVKRLYHYAASALAEIGFEVKDFDAEVSTMDGNLPSAERFYVVTFTTAKGGQIGVQGIMTSHGWPCLDHGVFLERG